MTRQMQDDRPAAAREDAERILSREACEAIVQRVFAMARGGGETRVAIGSWWQGELRWARNRVSLASDRRTIRVEIHRRIHNGWIGNVVTNQLDDESLQSAVRAAERTTGHASDMGYGV